MIQHDDGSEKIKKAIRKENSTDSLNCKVYINLSRSFRRTTEPAAMRNSWKTGLAKFII